MTIPLFGHGLIIFSENPHLTPSQQKNPSEIHLNEIFE